MTNEMMQKAMECHSAEELHALAKESGLEMTAEKSAELYTYIHREGELSDDELSGASGGGCKKEEKHNPPEPGDVCMRRDGEGCYRCGCKYFQYKGSCGNGNNVAWYDFICVNCGINNRVTCTGEIDPLWQYEELT